ncbi:hypothetical protein ACI3EW_01005 [Pilosibacter sp. HC1M1C21]
MNLPDGEALYLVTGDPMTVGGGRPDIPAPVRGSGRCRGGSRYQV